MAVSSATFFSSWNLLSILMSILTFVLTYVGQMFVNQKTWKLTAGMTDLYGMIIAVITGILVALGLYFGVESS